MMQLFLAVTSLVLFSLYFYKNHYQPKPMSSTEFKLRSTTDRQFLEQLQALFPHKKLPSSIYLQLISNLQQGGSREGILNYFLDDLQFDSEILGANKLLSLKQKIFVNELYHAHFKIELPQGEELDLLFYKRKIVADFYKVWPTRNDQDIAKLKQFLEACSEISGDDEANPEVALLMGLLSCLRNET
jgi:hypothetical protein